MSDASKRRVEYNLEKEPLQTGRVESGMDLASRASLGGEIHTSARRMGGWMYVLLVLMLLTIGILIGYLMSDTINALYLEKAPDVQ